MVAKLVVLVGLESSSDARVRSARRVFLKVHGLSQQGRKWVVRLAGFWAESSGGVALRVTSVCRSRKEVASDEEIREEYMQVTRELARWALELSGASTDSERQRRQVLVAQASFWATGYISKPRYLPEDNNSMETRRLRPREAGAEFRAAAVRSKKYYRKQQTLQVVTLRSIRVSENLLVEYSVM